VNAWQAYRADTGHLVLYRDPWSPAVTIETAGVLEDLGTQLGEKTMAPAMEAALKDPQVEAEITRVLQLALQADATRAIVRSYLWESAAWIAAGIVVGGIGWTIVRRYL